MKFMILRRLRNLGLLNLVLYCVCARSHSALVRIKSIDTYNVRCTVAVEKEALGTIKALEPYTQTHASAKNEISKITTAIVKEEKYNHRMEYTGNVCTVQSRTTHTHKHTNNNEKEIKLQATPKMKAHYDGSVRTIA